ncbi:MAG: T9SS type A sorting domain-containing protein [bacterium]|nr:T9SS type A sorting domain-containing protein [bacterium]
MKLATLLVILTTSVLTGFTQTEKWSAFLDTSTTLSSPRAVDLNNDNVLDIIIGGGLDGVPESNGVNAINGVDGSILWNFYAEDEMFGSAEFKDITGDNIKDVFIAGRYAQFYAIDGSSGNMIWEFFPYSTTQAVDSGWFNFYNPQFIPDQNSDGVEDILVANGGNHALPPWDTLRDPGMLMILDAMSGSVIAMDTMPDGEETYCSPTVFEHNGIFQIVYGSGGENDKGSLWRTTITDLMNDNLENSIQLVSDPSLGFIAPSSIADMNDDGFLDIINVAYDGTMRCFDGNNNSLIWQVDNPGTESSAGPTIGNFIGDATPDVFGVVYKGTAPTFTDFYQILVDGATGNVVWKDSLGSMQYGSSSAVDLDINGRDEAIVSLNYHNGTSFSHQVLAIDFQNDIITPMTPTEAGVNLATTVLIEDLDNNGFLDFVYGYRADSLNPMGDNGFYIKCLEGTNTIPPVGVAWGSYQGTNTDGHYNYQGTPCGSVTTSSNFQNISCNGFADGTVTVSPVTGVAPFTFLWNTGEIISSIDSMDVGTYTVLVTDATGCTTENTYIAEDPYDITFGSMQPPTCPGGNDGFSLVNSSGCPCMFSTCGFDWDSGDSTKTATMLVEGWNVVTVTHMDGCVVVDSVLIPNATPVMDSMTVGPIVCAANPLAASFIDLHLSDSANTTVSWSHGPTTSYVDSLDAGMYYVNLNDTIRGCFATDSVLLTAPDTLLVSLNAIDLSCFGDSSGMIDANAFGGQPQYQYNWSNGQATGTVTGLQAGWHVVEVTDSLGCVITDSVELIQPDELIANLTNSWNDSTGTCAGGAVVSMQGGTAPYSYQWDDPATTTSATVNGLCAGTYQVIITDDNGCTSTMDVTILNTLSVVELDGSEVSLYPNPANEVLHIDFTSDQLLGMKYKVLDNNGRLVMHGSLSQVSNAISLVNLATGVYFVELEGLSEVFHLVKQ